MERTKTINVESILTQLKIIRELIAIEVPELKTDFPIIEFTEQSLRETEHLHLGEGHLDGVCVTNVTEWITLTPLTKRAVRWDISHIAVNLGLPPATTIFISFENAIFILLHELAHTITPQIVTSDPRLMDNFQRKKGSTKIIKGGGPRSISHCEKFYQNFINLLRVAKNLNLFQSIAFDLHALQRLDLMDIKSAKVGVLLEQGLKLRKEAGYEELKIPLRISVTNHDGATKLFVIPFDEPDKIEFLKKQAKNKLRIKGEFSFEIIHEQDNRLVLEDIQLTQDMSIMIKKL